MLKEQRIGIVLDELSRNGIISIEDLAKKIDVSPSTIRRDIEELELQNSVRRVRGGAVSCTPSASFEPSYSARQDMFYDEKRRIAQAARSLISPNETLFLSGGTTVNEFSKTLYDISPLYIATNDLMSAVELSHFNNVDLIFTSHEHPCHFDPVLLLNAMKNNPNAISIMDVDIKNSMKSKFDENPGMEDRVFAPQIPVNSFIDTTLAGIKIRLTNFSHAGSGTLAINILLDSIQFVLFDDYNDLSLPNYQTIGFSQLPNDVALIGSKILNNQKLINDYYQPTDYITVSHIANMSTAYDGVVALADKFIANNYQMNVPRWPMEMFDYVKKDNRISLTMVNSAPKLSRTFKDIDVVRDETVKVYVPKSSFKDPDVGDSISYSFLISNKDLPEWATFDNEKFSLLLAPPKAQTYSVTIRATDRHLSTATATFKLKVTTPVGVEKFKLNNQFLVYPNPAQSLITIENQGNSDDIYAVQLYNTMGEKIYSVVDCSQSTIEIDLSRYPISSAFLVITKDGIPECHKIVRF